MTNTSKPRPRRFTTEEKHKIIKLSYEVGPTQAAKEAGIGSTTMYKWRRVAKDTPSSILPLNHADPAIKKAISNAQASQRELQNTIAREDAYIEEIKSRMTARQLEQVKDEQELAQRNANRDVLLRQVQAGEAYLGSFDANIRYAASHD